MALHTRSGSEQRKKAGVCSLGVYMYTVCCLFVLLSRATTIDRNMYGGISPCCMLDLDVGKNLWLNCTVTNKSVFEEDKAVLTFKRGAAEIEVDQQYLHYDGRSTVILNYTIQKYDRSSTYVCKAGSTVIGPPVTVRLPPHPVAPDNLTCVVNELQTYMDCWWNHPELYDANSFVTLNVTWHTRGRTDVVTPAKNDVLACPEMRNTSCRWSFKDFQSRRFLYHVTLTATSSNSDKTDSTTFVIDPQEQLLCDRVHAFGVLEVNSTCAQLIWNASTANAFSATYNKTFHVSMWPQRLPTSIYRQTTEATALVVCGLLPRTTYSSNISCRVRDDLPWGEATTLQFTTDLDYPPPPTSCAGCFYQSADGSIIVYWQPPRVEVTNGPLTGYEIRILDTTKGALSQVEANHDATSEAISNLQIDHNYTLSINSKNRISHSSTFVKFIIPAKANRPTEIVDMHVEMASSGDVNLTWRIPDPSVAFPRVNVIVVWCPTLPQSCTCQGPLRWRDVGDARAGFAMLPRDPTLTQLVDPSSTLYGLTVVGNWSQGVGVASGISWAKCRFPQLSNESHASFYDYWYCLLIALVVVVILIACFLVKQRRHLRYSPLSCKRPMYIESEIEMQNYEALNGKHSPSPSYSLSDIRQALDAIEE